MQTYSIMILCLVSSFGYAMENKDKKASAKKNEEMELLPLPHGSWEYLKKVAGQTKAVKDQCNIDQISKKQQRFQRELP